MSEVFHFQLMSKYNTRMNCQMYAATLTLTQQECVEDKGAFFKSINGTLNHLLVGDLLWFSRFASHSDQYFSLVEISALAQPKSLDDILIEDTTRLYEFRREVDGLIEKWANEELKEEHLSMSLTYKNAKGVRGNKVFRELVAHVFNHQTHHRGQLSTLLHQSGVDVGVTDFLLDVPDYA